jgi:serine/threonine protein phosphatase PrpC
MLNGMPKRFNQDAYLLVTDFAGVKHQLLLGVMDGHGAYGHEVSKYVRKHLPERLIDAQPTLCKSAADCSFEGAKFFELENALKTAYVAVNSLLRKDIDVVFSGTTAVTCLVRDTWVFCTNVGDSRAVIGRFNGADWEAVPLSKDHKPDDPLEKVRILKHGGRVEPITTDEGGFIGPSRVWLKTENIPGLAMSRSLGDVVASRVGVLATPDVIAHRLTPEDKFLLLGSDGLFEWLSNEVCVRLVAQYVKSKDTEAACECLVREATLQWQSRGPVVDDITVVIAFLKV